MLFQIPVLVSVAALLLPNALAMAVPADALSLPLNQRTGYQYGGIESRSAQEIINKLGLIPNVEKGYFIETFADPHKVANNRSASTAIYYLLEGKVGASIWHRLDAVELWHHYAGAPLTLSLSFNDGKKPEVKTLGPEIFKGQSPQVVIKKFQWQSARSLGPWTLVGTTVAPGFVIEGFELAEPGWVPNGAH